MVSFYRQAFKTPRQLEREGGNCERSSQEAEVWQKNWSQERCGNCPEISYVFGSDANETKSTGDVFTHCNNFIVSKPFLMNLFISVVRK